MTCDSNWLMTCDSTWLLTCDLTWLMTCDSWLMTHDLWLNVHNTWLDSRLKNANRQMNHNWKHLSYHHSPNHSSLMSTNSVCSWFNVTFASATFTMKPYTSLLRIWKLIPEKFVLYFSSMGKHKLFLEVNQIPLDSVNFTFLHIDASGEKPLHFGAT